MSQVSKSKEVQGLLFKVAELEALLIVLLGTLGEKQLLDPQEVSAIFQVAEMPEILSARIQQIEKRGEELINIRKKILSETLGIATCPEGEIFNTGEPIIEQALDEVGFIEATMPKGSGKKLH